VAAFTRPVSSLSFTPEPALSRLLGDLYATSPLWIVPPVIGWATSSGLATLFTLGLVGPFYGYQMVRLVAWAFRKTIRL
jgi:hypothetical protein